MWAIMIPASAEAMDVSKSLASLRHRIHQRKPKGKPMPEAMLRANGRRSKVRSAVEYVFARQKDKMKLFIRTVGLSRAKVKIGMANVAYNMRRCVWPNGKLQFA